MERCQKAVDPNVYLKSSYERVKCKRWGRARCWIIVQTNPKQLNWDVMCVGGGKKHNYAPFLDLTVMWESNRHHQVLPNTIKMSFWWSFTAIAPTQVLPDQTLMAKRNTIITDRKAAVRSFDFELCIIQIPQWSHQRECCDFVNKPAEGKLHSHWVPKNILHFFLLEK